MVADDNPDIVESMAMMLRNWGYEVIEALGGRDAIQKAAEEDLDVVFLDLSMPGISGLDVARKVRSAPANHRQPILIAHTAHGRPLHQQLTMDAGFDLFLVKPVAPEHLKNLLERFR